MGRLYAGVLGLLAMVVIVVRGVKDGAGAEGTLWTALIGLIVFAVVGLVLGSIAESTVKESVRQEMENQLAQQETGA